MAAFNTKKLILAPSFLIPTMGERISQSFVNEGFEVTSTPLSNGGYDVSITKGGMFKAVLGMKTALKVSLTPQGGNVYFDASVGIFGQQAIPTVISMFFFWPVLITQIWGMVEQSNLDDKALAIAEEVARNSSVKSSSSTTGRFCTNCGTQVSMQARFCPECGTKL